MATLRVRGSKRLEYRRLPPLEPGPLADKLEEWIETYETGAKIPSGLLDDILSAIAILRLSIGWLLPL